MEQKETKKRSSFMQNVLILMFAQIMVKVLGLVYKFVITNFEGFGDTGLGYYSAGYQIYSLLLALSSIGIPSVVSKLVSERIAKGDNKGAQRIFKNMYGILCRNRNSIIFWIVFWSRIYSNCNV